MRHAFQNRPRMQERTWWCLVIIPALVILVVLSHTDQPQNVERDRVTAQ